MCYGSYPTCRLAIHTPCLSCRRCLVGKTKKKCANTSPLIPETGIERKKTVTTASEPSFLKIPRKARTRTTVPSFEDMLGHRHPHTSPKENSNIRVRTPHNEEAPRFLDDGTIPTTHRTIMCTPSGPPSLERVVWADVYVVSGVRCPTTKKKKVRRRKWIFVAAGGPPPTSNTGCV